MWLYAVGGLLVGFFLGFTYSGTIVLQNLTPEERRRFMCRVQARSPSLKSLCE